MLARNHLLDLVFKLRICAVGEIESGNVYILVTLSMYEFQELLYTLMWMDKCGTEAEPSRVIKKNVFYLPEYRELCYSLLLNFDPVKFSK